MLGRRKVRLVESNDYANIASSYQYKMLTCLNEALANNGIEKESRRQIMTDFAFDFGVIHDQGEEFVSDNSEKPNRSFVPMIAFRDRNEILTDGVGFQFHESAHGNVDAAIKAPLSQLVSMFHRNKRAQ